MMSKKIIAVSGASGFLGTHLCHALRDAGYEVWPMVRKKSAQASAIFYDYTTGEIERDKLAQCHGVIHLAGKNIFTGSWGRGPACEVYDSRVKSAELIAQTVSELEPGPKVFLCASAIGFYGDGGSKKLTEKSPGGEGFLAELCAAWERACMPAQEASVRVVNMRFGIILDKSGGMLKTLLPIFKAGLGGPVGHGQQFLSFIAMTDICRAIIFLLEHDQISGPVNLVAPVPITNGDFAKELGFALKRPSCLRTPAFAVKLLGQKSSMLLNSTRVMPKVLLDAGFSFTYTDLAQYLAHEIYR